MAVLWELSSEEAAEERRYHDLMAINTPEEAIRHEEASIKAGLCAEPPDFLHWHLWVCWQYRQKRIGLAAKMTGEGIRRRHVLPGGKIDAAALAQDSFHRSSPAAVKSHLRQLIKAGADFSRLESWPHPLAD